MLSVLWPDYPVASGSNVGYHRVYAQGVGWHSDGRPVRSLLAAPDLHHDPPEADDEAF